MKSPLADIAKNWKVVKISEVLFFQEGPGVRKWQFTDNGVKLLNVGNINKGQLNLDATSIFLSESEAFGKYSHFLVDSGDLLIACSGIVLENFHNKITFAEQKHLPLCLNTSTMRFKPLDKHEIDINFFKYFLQTRHFNSQLRKLITGSAQLNFGPSHIKKIDVFLPPLSEQQKIAKILDAADAIRQKDQQLIDHYTALSQSLFLDMFGDPVNNPMEWKLKEFGNIFNSIKYGTSTPPQYSKDGIPFIRATNIKKGGVALKGMVYISLEESKKILKCKLSEGDLIIVRSGANTGDCGRIPLKYVDAYGGFDLIISINDPHSTFYNFLLNTNAGKAILKPLTRRAGQPHLNSKQVSSLNLIAPPEILQNQFTERLTIIEKQIQQAQASLEQSNNLFNSLLQKAFTGELTQQPDQVA